MATKTLTITEEAYNFLKSQKGTDQSFSEVIMSIKERQRPDYSRFGAFLSKESAQSILDARKEDRILEEERERRLDERRRHLSHS